MEQHPSHTNRPPSHARAHEVAQGKPFLKDKHPLTHKKNPKANKGKPFKGENHPSSRGKNHRKGPGKPDKGLDHPSSHAQGNQNPKKGKGKPLWGGESISNHAKQEAVIEHSLSSQDEGFQIANASPVQGKGKANGFGKGKEKSRGKQKQQTDTASASPAQSNGKANGFGKGKEKNRGKHKQQTDTASASPVQGKGKANGFGKGKENSRGKQKQQTDTAAVVTNQQTTSRSVPLKTTPASFEPLVFDNEQRLIIQEYYKNSGSQKPNKGRGKQNKRLKNNQYSSMTKNDILTQSSQPLPQRLESKLPPSPPNTKRVLYNQQVLLIEEGTNRVLDTIRIKK